MTKLAIVPFTVLLETVFLNKKFRSCKAPVDITPFFILTFWFLFHLSKIRKRMYVMYPYLKRIWKGLQIYPKKEKKKIEGGASGPNLMQLVNK